MIDDIVIILRKVPLFRISSKIYKILQYFYFRKERKKNIYLKNIHNGGKCYIIGNGISASVLGIEELRSSYVFACNEIFNHKKFKEMRIDYYTVMEPFYGRILGKKYVQDTLKLYTEISGAFQEKKSTLFFNASLKRFFGSNGLFENNKVNFLTPLSKSEKGAYNDLHGKFTFGEGAFNFMVASAIYMGFKEIYLIGCGYTYSPRQQFHFYSRPSYLKSKYSYEAMIQKVKKDYLKEGLKITSIEENDLSYLPVITSPFKDDSISKNQVQIREFANANSTKIVNITPGGYDSPIFESIKENELY